MNVVIPRYNASPGLKSNKCNINLRLKLRPNINERYDSSLYRISRFEIL